MRAFLLARGFDVKANVATTRTGDLAFEIKDPDGTLVEFWQAQPDGMESKAAGKFMPPTRIAASIYHVGFLVGNSEKSLAFYRDLLGFQETWRGSSRGDELSWINLRVPDGDDYIELMLYHGAPASHGTSNHVSLLVPDVVKATALLKTRPAYQLYGKPLEVKTGKNGKQQLNLYDPDGTRVELMEAHTIDGKPRPSSTAPPPPPVHP